MSEKLLGGAKSAHLIGIGGVSMRALADILHGAGLRVTGSDAADSPAVEELRQKGIFITVGHAAANFPRAADVVIRTAAVGDANPEIRLARELEIPVLERAQVCGEIMRHYKNVLCIAGTHGKTTTTGMCAHIALAAGIDPTIMLGGGLPAIGGVHRAGRGGTMIFEACEYRDSFLSFFPTVAVVLNIDADHLDYFRDLEHIKASFRAFCERVPEHGTVIINADDKNAVSALDGIDRRVVTYGENGFVRVAGKQIFVGEKHYADMNLRVPGKHNASNALAAAAAAYALGLDGASVSAGLSAFGGTERRFEHKGEYNGAALVDDYAHHPAEIAATLSAARDAGYERVLAVFQPHTYSRVEKLFDEFAAALTAADKVYLAEIYAARETPTGASSRRFEAAVPNAEYFGTLREIAEAVKKDVRPGDLVITLGAGDVNRVLDHLAV